MSDVVMPQMGESIVEGTLTRWLKSGRPRERDEPSKSPPTKWMEIPSSAAR